MNPITALGQLMFNVATDNAVNSVLNKLANYRDMHEMKKNLQENFEIFIINNDNNTISNNTRNNYKKWIKIIDGEETPDDFIKKIDFELSKKLDSYENQLLYMLYFSKTVIYYKKDKDNGTVFFYTDIRRILEESTEQLDEISSDILNLSKFIKDKLSNDIKRIYELLDSKIGNWDIDFISEVESNNYIDKYESALILEESYNEKIYTKKLIDVYIEPRFTDNNKIYSINDLFPLFKDFKEKYDKQIKQDENNHKKVVLKDTILIEANAGVGKTSFISHLAYNLNNYNIDFEKVYILNFKNMYIENSKIYYYINKANHENSNKSICFDNIKKNSLFIIDSYDECKFTDKENEIFLKFKLLTMNKNCKYIVMSRPFNFTDNKYIHKCSIKNLNKNEINDFYKNYLNDMQDKPNNIYNDDLKEVLEIPLVLYMYLFNLKTMFRKKTKSDRKTLSDIIIKSTSLFQVYDKLLGEDSYILTKDKTNNSKDKHSKENISEVRNSLKEIAFEMYKSGLDLKLTKELKKHRRNTNKTKLFDFYLRYNENSNDSSDTITFIHKSFYEYFLSEYFLDRLNEIEDVIPKENNDYEEIYNRYTDIFCTPITAEDSNLLNFIEYHLIEDKERALTNKKYDILLDEIRSSYYDNQYNSNLKYIKDFMLLNCVSKNTIRENIGKDNVNLYFTLLQIILIVTKQAITEKYVDFFEIKEISELIKKHNNDMSKTDINNQELIDKALALAGDLYEYNLIEQIHYLKLYINSIGYTKTQSNDTEEFISVNEFSKIIQILDLYIKNSEYIGATKYILNNVKEIIYLNIFYNMCYINKINYISFELKYLFFDNIDITQLNFKNVHLYCCSLVESNFTKLDLSNINMRKCLLCKASLVKTDLSNADLSDANLLQANLLQANLSVANLSNADLSEADLSDANLLNANLSWADLSDAILSDANLLWADLYQANLSNANLSEVNLFEANLSEANLSKANLSKANLSFANLLNAKNLNKTNLSCASINNESYKLMYKTIHKTEEDIDFESIDFEEVKSEVKMELKARGCIGVDEIIDIY